MDPFSTDDLRVLVEARGGLRVSIYMPTERGGRLTRKNPIYFEGLLRRAKVRMAKRGADPEEVDRVLEPAREAIGDEEFWGHPEDGLAVFLSARLRRFQRLPERFKEWLFAADRFYTKPLFRLADDGDPFYVLALSKNAVRLLRAERTGAQELHPERMPSSFDDAIRLDDPPAEIQSHTLGGSLAGRSGTVLYHGHGSAADLEKGDLFLFCRRVDQALRPLLAAQRPRLVLAAVEELWPFYREANTCTRLIEGIRGNPEPLSAQALCERAQALIAAREDGAAQTLAAYERLPHPDRGSDRPELIVPAAAEGRVDRLLVAADRPLWGRCDPFTHGLELDGAETPTSDDLSDWAAAETWRHGGTVHVVPIAQMPLRAPLLATFRY